MELVSLYTNAPPIPTDGPLVKMDEHSKVLLGMDDYSRELARILRELLAAGSKRDRDKMLELANDIENLVPLFDPGKR